MPVISSPVIDAPTTPPLVRSLLARMEERGLADHALRVCALTAAVARRMGLSERPAHVVALAALLHDVGKLAVPPDVLDHPGRLTGRDWELMRDHAELGERTLRACPGLEGLAPLVRHSHERRDGLGYPDGLRREMIPLGSRIIAACDAWDAMRMKRAYRGPVGHDEALWRIVAEAGAQFDPNVVAALVAEVSRGGLR